MEMMKLLARLLPSVLGGGVCLRVRTLPGRSYRLHAFHFPDPMFAWAGSYLDLHHLLRGLRAVGGRGALAALLGTGQ